MEARIPTQMETPRYRAQRTVEIPNGEIPLVHPKDPPEKQVRYRLIARVKVFDLLKPEERDAYEKVWQDICDGRAKLSEAPTPTYDPAKGVMLAMIRYSDIAHVAPGANP